MICGRDGNAAVVVLMEGLRVVWGCLFLLYRVWVVEVCVVVSKLVDCADRREAVGSGGFCGLLCHVGGGVVGLCVGIGVSCLILFFFLQKWMVFV